jgi:hypothetical protein
MRLRRWHVWLGWLVGLPMLFWTVSGLVMVASRSRKCAASISLPIRSRSASTGRWLRRARGLPVTAITLKPRADGPRWEIDFAGGEKRLADPLSGRILPRLGAADAAGN